MWATSFGAPQGPPYYANYVPFALAVGADGDIVMAGSFRGVVDFGGGPLTSAWDDVFVTKVDRMGRHVWSQRFGGDGGFAELEGARAIALDASGNVYVTGIFSNPYGAASITFGDTTLRNPDGAHGGLFLAKLDRDGTPVWSKAFLGTSPVTSSVGMALSADPTGRIVVSGRLGGATDLGGGAIATVGLGSAFVASFDPDGHHVWSQAFSAAGGAISLAFTHRADAAGDIVLGGTFQGAIDFHDPAGTAVLARADYEQVGFVAKLDRDGHHMWSRAIESAGSLVTGLALDDRGELRMTGMLREAGDGAAEFTFTRFVSRLDAEGHEVWRAAFPGDGSPISAGGLAAGEDGVTYLASGFRGTLPLPLLDASITSAGATDAYVLALDREGKALWSRRAGDVAPQTALQLALGRPEKSESPCEVELVTAGTFVGTLALERSDGGLIALDASADAFVATTGAGFLARLTP